MTSGEDEVAGAGLGVRRTLVATHGGVTRAELFLDLVFVFAFMNVAGLMAARSAFDALVQGGLVLLLLWRSWAGYAWVGNLVRLDRGILPIVMFMVATALLLVAVAIPDVFVDRHAGLSAPLVFVVGFLSIRAVSLLIIMRSRRRSTQQSIAPARQAWLPLAASAVLLLCGALLPSHLAPGRSAGLLQILLFAVATAVDYVGLRAPGTGSWQLRSVRHWAERHNLIMLIALGETIISIGTSRGFAGTPAITWSVLAGSGLALLVVAFLWWAYFDIAALDAEQTLESVPHHARSRLARDAYTLLHLPMIAGLILVAFGLKHALGATEIDTAKKWDAPALFSLYGGVVLYLLGLVAFEWCMVRRIGRGPLLGIVLVALLAPVARTVEAVASLGILAGALVCVVLAHVTVLRKRHRGLHRVVAVTAGREVEATPEDLFLDLVFVYAFIQVTVLMTRHPGATGVFHGLAVLALLWWSWINHTWYTTVVRGSANVRRLIVLTEVTLTLMLGIATPQAFSHVPGGLPGPAIVVLTYVAVRVLQLAALWIPLRRDTALPTAVIRAAAPTCVAAVLLVGAVLAGGATGPATPLSTALWVAGIAVDLSSGYLTGARNWQLGQVSRWMGRYNLIILIALGQAVISTGMAVAGLPASGPALLCVALGALLLSALWWTYVGTDVVIGERFTELTTPRQRGALARDAYTYLHLFLVVGLVLVAFGLRTSLAIPGQLGPATPAGQVILVCGLIVFLLTDHLVWRRARRTVTRPRALTLLVAALAPLTILLPVREALILLILSLSSVHLLARTTRPRPGSHPARGT
ncbi:low temperature requirement protein A [Micromonospora aurantiaca (nom. illeg.)]|uniref:low temperature requirement protein A n=1 Tax=Micromonospora aurantiaca (nom. illeg.) TaxID=47850 RepID=UPI00160D691A